MNKIFPKLVSGVLLCTTLTYTTPILAFTKDETVYSRSDLTGKVYNTIVTDHVKNNECSDLINDMSDLFDITNIGGDETCSKDGTSLVWSSGGNDIYYQGNSQKDLPIQCDIKYELDGVPLSAKDVVGKSGKVKITLTYSNTSSHTVNINEKTETLYTPFIVLCGTVLNNDTNKNIAVSSGKIVDNGNKTAIIGFSFPGLQESLGISSDTLKIPNSVEITMDSTYFEMNNIFSYATPKVIENDNSDLIKNFNKLLGQLDTLQSASKQLEVGANTLKDGSVTYSEKSKEFNAALKQVSNGISNASLSYSEINNGISLISNTSSSLQTYVKTISDGSTAISANMLAFSENVNTWQEGVQVLKDGEKALSSSVSSFISNLNGLNQDDQSAEITKLQNLISANTNLRDSLVLENSNLNKQLSLGDLTTEEQANISSKIAFNSNIINVLNANISSNNSTLNLLKATDSSSMQQFQVALNSLQQGLQSFDNGIDSLYNGAEQLQTGANMLATKTAELSQGAQALYKGTVQLSAGASVLSSGSAEMQVGLNTLDNVSKQLISANNQLTDGAQTLANGAETLSLGINKFNTEGIQKICAYVDGDLGDILERIDKLQNLSKEYNNFTMLDAKNNGTVKFIMIVDSLKEEDNVKQEIIIKNENEKNDE